MKNEIWKIIRTALNLLAVFLLVTVPVFTQTPAPSPQTESSDCTQAKAIVTRLETRLRDWPALARYREDNEKIGLPLKTESNRATFLK